MARITRVIFSIFPRAFSFLICSILSLLTKISLFLEKGRQAIGKKTSAVEYACLVKGKALKHIASLLLLSSASWFGTAVANRKEEKRRKKKKRLFFFLKTHLSGFVSCFFFFYIYIFSGFSCVPMTIHNRKCGFVILSRIFTIKIGVFGCGIL